MYAPILHRKGTAAAFLTIVFPRRCAKKPRFICVDLNSP